MSAAIAQPIVDPDVKVNDSKGRDGNDTSLACCWDPDPTAPPCVDPDWAKCCFNREKACFGGPTPGLTCTNGGVCVPCDDEPKKQREMWIAVAPWDPNILVATWTDGSKEWSGESATGDPPPEVVGATSLRVVRSPLSAQSDTITVRVFTETALDDLQSYQLELRVSGGTSGQFDLLDIFIEPRSDYVYAGLQDNFTAFNTVSGQMLSGLIDVSAGVRAPPHAYLATYTYRASPTATGDFVVDVPHDESLGDQTFLVASFNKKIEITDSTPAVVATAP